MAAASPAWSRHAHGRRSRAHQSQPMRAVATRARVHSARCSARPPSHSRDRTPNRLLLHRALIWRRFAAFCIHVVPPPCSFLHSLVLMHTLVVCTRQRTNSGLSTNSGSLHCVLHIGGGRCAALYSDVVSLCCVLHSCGGVLLCHATVWRPFSPLCGTCAILLTFCNDLVLIL